MNLKGLDFFRKVHSDIESSTLTGGLFSILAFLVINYLFSLDFICFSKKSNIFKVKKFTETC